MVAKKRTPEYEVWTKTPGYEKWKQKIQNKAIINHEDPEFQLKYNEGIQRRNQDLTFSESINKGIREKRANNVEWKRKQYELHQNPEFELKRINALRKVQETNEWKNNVIVANQNNAQNPEWRYKNKIKNQKLAKNPEWRLKFLNGLKNKNRDFYNDQNYLDKMNKVYESFEWKCKVLEGRIGGFWYGNVRYLKRAKYCELWNKDLWKRIDAFWDYKSSLSGLTKEDNKDKNGKIVALHRHHVYYQPKACCDYNENREQYIAHINIGSSLNPNFIDYDIEDNNPNKFVLLTSKEHGQAGHNKLKWIKIFEDIIEQCGGKSYYTKEEMENLGN